MNLFKRYFILFFIVLLVGCRHQEEPFNGNKEVRQMTLIYAVNNNNLSYDLKVNEDQMLKAMENVDPEEYKLLLYKYTSDGYGLYEVCNVNGRLQFVLLKSYEKSIPAVSADRISNVINDALGAYPGVPSNLFFWGHGLGWINPYKYSSTVIGKNASSESVEHLPEVYAFGGEYVEEDNVRNTVYIDLDQLADAIPDGKFDMIWFDCCYMSCIEVAYQLRNKCNTYVAYPTEIMGEGLPYNLVFPHIIGDNVDRVEAAKALYGYYTGKYSLDPVTVAVMDMESIDGVAEAAKRIIASGNILPSIAGMQNYSRMKGVGYYDFGQYMRKYADVNGKSSDADVEQLNLALKKFVIYSDASELDFRGYPIDKSNFSGLSVHNFANVNSAMDDYYRKLDWYKHVWQKPGVAE